MYTKLQKLFTEGNIKYHETWIEIENDINSKIQNLLKKFSAPITQTEAQNIEAICNHIFPSLPNHMSSVLERKLKSQLIIYKENRKNLHTEINDTLLKGSFDDKKDFYKKLKSKNDREAIFTIKKFLLKECKILKSKIIADLNSKKYQQAAKKIYNLRKYKDEFDSGYDKEFSIIYNSAINIFESSINELIDRVSKLPANIEQYAILSIGQQFKEDTNILRLLTGFAIPKIFKVDWNLEVKKTMNALNLKLIKITTVLNNRIDRSFQKLDYYTLSTCMDLIQELEKNKVLQVIKDQEIFMSSDNATLIKVKSYKDEIKKINKYLEELVNDISDISLIQDKTKHNHNDRVEYFNHLNAKASFINEICKCDHIRNNKLYQHLQKVLTDKNR